MKRNYIIMGIILFSILLISLSGCIVKKDSPAPGCIEYWGPAPMMGGCFGKSVILDLNVEPGTDCLKIEVNNCNGGILEVSNLCDESFVLGGVEIKPEERNVGLDVSKREDGEYLMNITYSNFAEYIPKENETIEISGKLGEKDVKVSFIKTKELC